MRTFRAVAKRRVSRRAGMRTFRAVDAAGENGPHGGPYEPPTRSNPWVGVEVEMFMDQ